MKNYGFNYTHDGKNYAFHVVATSAEEAESKVRAMSAATPFGELQESLPMPMPMRAVRIQLAQLLANHKILVGLSA